ncbi:AAA family ATPase [Saccharothrix longispora]|uniref:Non-specific serine/threonine protein kinase n=1 Tax=Saccharothrix longispora TaxID=33920 RepID=A0ABU1PUR8_9PSEU|nr:AAA family ATPase [Saccharothrix longispora]MDR6593639.1 non-specific serine/threonine protein kinase [Saccharothrix longispora]
MTTFIGRRKLLKTTMELLGTMRLVTLTGAGGVGKTRLLERLAADLAEGFDEVVLVALAGLKATEDRLASTIAEALGLPNNSPTPAAARLIEALSTRGKVLLALDNCEHLLGSEPGAGQVPRLLRHLLAALPRLQVVATSRENLGVLGEHIVPVPPLSVANNDFACAEECSCCAPEAVQLLVDRARAVGVEIPAADYPVAIELCEALDGIPLNIELAAVQLETMTLHEMLAQRRALLDTLVGGDARQEQHRSVRATLDWSYGLLAEPLRQMWALLSVFAGGFGLDAVAAVAESRGIDRAEVRSLLTRLKRKSLLVVDKRGASTRFRLLETIRLYGEELAEASGESTTLRSAHAQYFLSLTEQAAERWLGPDEVVWMQRVRTELPNIRAAQEFVLAAGHTRSALRLTVNTGRSRALVFAGRINDGRDMMATALDESPETPTVDRLSGLSLAAWLAFIQGSQAVALPLLEQAEDGARALECQDTFPPLLYARATRLWLIEEDPTLALGAVEGYGKAERAFLAAGCEGDAFMALMFGAMSAAFVADGDTAFAWCRRLLATAEKAKAEWSVSWALWTSALAELLHGDPCEALVLARRTLRVQLAIGDTWGPAWTKWLLFLVAVELGDYERGAQLMGAATAARKLTNASIFGLLPWLRVQQRAENKARGELGDEEFDISAALGERVAADGVMALASELRGRPMVNVRRPAELSRKEFVVASLVARDMSNREIGEALEGLSHRTVEVHVSNIIRKLVAEHPDRGVKRRQHIRDWFLGLSADEIAAGLAEA